MVLLASRSIFDGFGIATDSARNLASLIVLACDKLSIFLRCAPLINRRANRAARFRNRSAARGVDAAGRHALGRIREPEDSDNAESAFSQGSSLVEQRGA
jgi:hypothetical protein